MDDTPNTAATIVAEAGTAPPNATPPTPAARKQAAAAAEAASTDAVDLAAYRAVKSNRDASDAQVRTAFTEKLAAGQDAGAGDTTASIATEGDDPAAEVKEDPAAEGEGAETLETETPGEPKPAKGAAAAKPGDAALAAKLNALKPAERVKYIQAESALRRDGYDDAEVADMVGTLGVEKTIALGLKRKAAQEKADKAWSQRRADAADPNNASPRPAARHAPDKGEAADAGGGDDPDGAPGEPDPIDEELKGLTPKQREAVRQRIKAGETRASELQTAHERSLIVSSIERLTPDFPALKKVEGQRQVLEQMNELDPTGAALKSPAALEALLRKASWAVFGEQIKNQAHQDRRAAANATLDGQPTVPRSTGKNTQALSQDEYEAQAFKAVKASFGDVNTARRLLAKA